MNYIDWPLAAARLIWPDGSYDSKLAEPVAAGASGGRPWLYMSIDNTENDLAGVTSFDKASYVLGEACERGLIKSEGRPTAFAIPEAIPANAWRGGAVRCGFDGVDGTCDLGPAANRNVTWYYDIHVCEADLSTFLSKQWELEVIQHRWDDIIDRASRAYIAKAAERRLEKPLGGHIIRKMIRDLGDTLDDIIDDHLTPFLAGAGPDARKVASDAILAFVDEAEKTVITFAWSQFAAETKRPTAIVKAQEMIEGQRQRVRRAFADRPLSNASNAHHSNVGSLAEPESGKDRTLDDVLADAGPLPTRRKRGRPSAKEAYTELNAALMAQGRHADTAWMQAHNIAHILKTDSKYADTPKVSADTIYNVIVKDYPRKS